MLSDGTGSAGQIESLAELGVLHQVSKGWCRSCGEPGAHSHSCSAFVFLLLLCFDLARLKILEYFCLCAAPSTLPEA